MNQLITQDVQPLEHDGQHFLGVHSSERATGRVLMPVETVDPLALENQAVVIIPERLEHKPVADQQANRLWEVLPYDSVQKMGLIGVHETVKEFQKQSCFGESASIVNFVRVRSVERNPDAAFFNKNLGAWNVTYGVTMESMFKGAAGFNWDGSPGEVYC